MSRSIGWLTVMVAVYAFLGFTPVSRGAEVDPNPSVTQSADGSPRVTADHRIVAGSKGVWQKGKYGSLDLSLDGDAMGRYFEMFNLGDGELATVFFMNKEIEHTDAGSIFTADVRSATSNETKLGTYRFSMTLQSNGLIRVDSVLNLDDPSILTQRYAILDLPEYLRITGELVKNGKAKPFDDSATITLAGDDLKNLQIRCFPDNSARSFTIIPVACEQVILNGKRISFIPPEGERMSYLLDIRGDGEDESAVPVEMSPNGIDFWGVDRLHLPQYSVSRNLIINPSFEAGLRYWGFPIYVHDTIPLKYQNVFALDTEVARSGTNSLRLRALPVRSPLTLGHFPIPYVPGENYTYSFYAKHAPGKPAVVNVWGRGQDSQLFPENVLTFKLTEDWQRYSIPFVAKERFSCIYMDARSGTGLEDDDQFAWIDDVQLEQGDATEFMQRPIAPQLVSAARGNFLEFGQAPDFKMNIHSTPNTAGKFSLAVEDFYFQNIFKGDYTFTTDETGRASVELTELTDKVVADQLRGVLEVSGVFTVDGVDEPYQDYFRFSVMDFLENKHKNKDIFNLTYVYSLQSGGPEMERFMERERAIGFGSICYDFVKFANDLDYDHDRERMELVEKYGFGYMGRPVLKLHDGEGGEISEKQGQIKLSNIKSMTDPTDEQLAEFEDIVTLKAKNRPWNKLWWFTGESNPGVMPLEAHPDAFAKFLLATYRGVKRGNPDAEVLIEGGPWTMETQYGAKWVERYIRDTKRLDPSITFDGAAAHHYRNFPERPDLDTDIAAFLEMLDRNGHSDWPFHVNEGGNYIPFNIPQEGISPYIVHSGNSWYIGPLSYDYGRAERISAALSARNWLIGLKYADRVACMQDFNSPNRYVDIDFTPRPYDKIPNTLGRLLGDASFKQDIRFAPETRCYIFTDDKTGSPIASLWGYKESVDRWKEEAPQFKFDFTGVDVTFMDLMENEVDYPKDAQGRHVIPLSPFPFFIRSEPGTEAQLAEAIAGGVAASASRSTLTISAIPTEPGRASVVFKNTVAKGFKGEGKMTVNGETTNLPLRVPSLKTRMKTIGLNDESKAYGKLLDFNFSFEIDGEQVSRITNPYLFVKPQARSSREGLNDFARWTELPGNDLGGGVTFKTAIEDRKLWLAFEVKDPAVPARELFVGMGIYAAPFGKLDGWDSPKSAKQDLAVFELVKTADAGMEAMCLYVQGTQAGSGTKFLVPGQVQSAIDVHVLDQSGSAVVLLSIPQNVLAPLQLEPGNRFGLNVSLPIAADAPFTLATIQNYVSPSEPGEIDMVLVVIDK